MKRPAPWRRNRKIVGGGGILTRQWLDGRLPLLIIEKSSTAEIVYYKPWLDTRSCPLCAIRLARIFKFCGVLLLATALLSLYYLSFPKEYDIVRRAEVFQNLRAFKSMRARSVLSALCDAYETDAISGDLCHRLCFTRNWNISTMYERRKTVIILHMGGQKVVLKTLYASIDQYPRPDPGASQQAFVDALLDIVNNVLRLGWPSYYKRNLITLLWPKYQRMSYTPFSKADRISLWALVSQNEYVNLRALTLSRVTPKIVGTCGHFYQVESLIAFGVRPFFQRLRANIFHHMLGTLKLLEEFINEPLQMCDFRFENLGLGKSYPKRFMVLDATELYTQSRLNALLSTRRCESDDDCTLLSCAAKCNLTKGYCTNRVNLNVEVFCSDLFPQLYGRRWPKSDWFVAACDTSLSMEERLTKLRLAWVWIVPDV